MSTPITPSPIELNAELVQVPSNAKVERSRKIVDTMVATGQLTPTGKAWLTVNSDPWHDTKIVGFRGVPDQDPGNVVTMSIVQELNIKKPAGLAAGNWSCRVTSNPFASSWSSRQKYMVGNVLAYQSPESSLTHWPVQVDFVNDGSNFPLYGNADTVGMEIPATFLKGPYQVCAMGIETVNTTASLQKQGLATCAVMNNSTYEPFTCTAYSAATMPVTSVNNVAASFYAVKSAPQNLSEMLLLPNTTQWEAAEGAYSVVQLLGFGKKPPSNCPVYPLLMNDDFNPETSVPSVANSFDVRCPRIDNALMGSMSGTTVSFFPKVCGQVPMNTTIQMYTGLSDTTTLTVRVRFVVQRRPNDNEAEIIVLAEPCAVWDPVALELQARLMNILPPAVMFRENPKGEWWKSMLAGIADIASSGLMMMPHPLAKGAGAAIMAGRAILAPDHPVQFKSTTTKNAVVPAKRRPQKVKTVKLTTDKQVKENRRKRKKKAVKKA